MSEGHEIERRGEVGAGMTRTDGAGGTSLTKSGETSSSAAAAMARANVEARFVMARHQPRDEDTARIKILRECDRPRFAEAAEYELPRAGKTITGPSIRFAEGLARHFGNLAIESVVTFEDATARLVRCTVTDLESNATYSQDVSVEKTVERKNAKPSDDVIGTRVTSQGHSVYIIRANDADLLAKHNGLVSRAMRTLILRLVPGDLVDEALDRTRATLRKEDAQDPQAAKRKILDAFAEIGVMPAQLAEALGASLDAVSPAQLGTLRRWFSAIRSGETTIRELLDEQRKTASASSSDEKPAPSTKAAKVAAAAKAAAKASAPINEAGPSVFTDHAPAEALEQQRRAAAIARGEDPDA
jgi:hypothetical protein